MDSSRKGFVELVGRRYRAGCTAAYTTKNMEYYVDFAAQSGFPYMLLDAGWADGRDITKLRGNVDVPELVRYAAQKHVKVWIWLYSTSVMEQMKRLLAL